ncbi:hypothetical protein A3K86_20015 [Photobacterium jeanii]|uniref:DNA mismatch repair protein n=1 Tax=Photobacterium jeanii TaxID=858640 RepID=A0A178K4N8_9GAMM|nr:hypothetical protein [Photobacterium jeanii]OAN11704.1 hypothetical protein A3K86_20015 [Photobacterium jeanii]PST91237.1 hypothetical protein C9I91_09125 [Photobacterium jeanii]
MTRSWQIPTWTLVAVGLLLNIISALMTNFYIEGATQDANRLTQQQIANDKLIALTWQQVEALDRKKEFLLMMARVGEASATTMSLELASLVSSDLKVWLDEVPKQLTLVELPNILMALENIQAEQREKVNQLYIENLTLIERYASKSKSISMLRSLALFLQIIGLALVLSRDLSKRDYVKK